MKIEELISKHEFQLSEVFRQYNIVQPGMQGIKAGYDAYGNRFMLQVIEALKDENHFSNFEHVSTPEGDFIGSVQISSPEAVTTKSGWTFWENLLTTVGKTGETIGKFKENVAGSATTSNTPATPYTVGDSKPNNIILYVAGAAVLTIVLILIFRKK